MAHPSASPSDVLTLNLGGEKVVQRWRSTLCVVEDSFLAARFSGRWERGLDRDEEGRHFINYPPYLFMPLLDYLSTVQTETHAVPLPCGPHCWNNNDNNTSTNYNRTYYYYYYYYY